MEKSFCEPAYPHLVSLKLDQKAKFQIGFFLTLRIFFRKFSISSRLRLKLLQYDISLLPIRCFFFCFSWLKNKISVIGRFGRTKSDEKSISYFKILFESRKKGLSVIYHSSHSNYYCLILLGKQKIRKKTKTHTNTKPSTFFK